MLEAPSRTYDVFLSYSSKDKIWADAACAVLERHRVRCWIAPRDITPGDEWGAAIIKGLNGSRIMVLIFSGHANDSGQVRREVERAISQGMTVLPVRIEDVRPAGAMEYALGNTHWLDAFTPPVEAQLELLAASVKKLLGRDAGQKPSGPGTGPVDPPEPRRTGAGWPIAIGTTFLCLVALGVIVTTMRSKNGETKTRSPTTCPGKLFGTVRVMPTRQPILLESSRSLQLAYPPVISKGPHGQAGSMTYQRQAPRASCRRSHQGRSSTRSA